MNKKQRKGEDKKVKKKRKKGLNLKEIKKVKNKKDLLANLEAETKIKSIKIINLENEESRVELTSINREGIAQALHLPIRKMRGMYLMTLNRCRNWLK